MNNAKFEDLLTFESDILNLDNLKNNKYSNYFNPPKYSLGKSSNTTQLKGGNQNQKSLISFNSPYSLNYKPKLSNLMSSSIPLYPSNFQSFGINKRYSYNTIKDSKNNSSMLNLKNRNQFNRPNNNASNFSDNLYYFDNNQTQNKNQKYSPYDPENFGDNLNSNVCEDAIKLNNDNKFNNYYNAFKNNIEYINNNKNFQENYEYFNDLNNISKFNPIKNRKENFNSYIDKYSTIVKNKNDENFDQNKIQEVGGQQITSERNNHDNYKTINFGIKPQNLKNNQKDYELNYNFDSPDKEVKCKRNFNGLTKKYILSKIHKERYPNLNYEEPTSNYSLNPLYDFKDNIENINYLKNIKPKLQQSKFPSTLCKLGPIFKKQRFYKSKLNLTPALNRSRPQCCYCSRFMDPLYHEKTKTSQQIHKS